MISVPEDAVFTVLGSGFGMYGYLPALIECGAKVVLPDRYRSTVVGRPELIQYVPQVAWCVTAEEALIRANGAVVALRPADQADWIPRLARMPNIRDLILEKPVAPTPQLAASLIAELAQAGKRYRIGYTFRFLPWAERLRAALQSGTEEVSLDWMFLAHHYRANLDNWKRFDASGGGALRFYGIHLIALLAELGYDDVTSSVLAGPSVAETARWEATFTGKALCPFELRIDSRADETCFRMVAYTRRADDILVNQPDPFSSVRSATLYVRDPRVDLLGRLCRSLAEPDEIHAQRQRDIIALWGRIEAWSRRSPHH
jgi:predicted dehydrogenase